MSWPSGLRWAVAEPVSFEMTITRAELLRLLPGAVGGALTEEDGAFVGPGWRIRLEPMPPLVLGAIAMERLRVVLAFPGLTTREQSVFLERFKNHTRRGGG